MFSYYHVLIFIDTFPIMVLAPKQLHINDGELLSSVLCREFWRTSFSCSQTQMFFMICGPKAPGATGILMPTGFVL